MLIPIVIGVIALGRNFDLNTFTSAIHIFDPADIAKSTNIIKKSYVKSQYRFLESSEDVNNFLNIGGELAIKVKNGDISLKGVGSYLSSNVDREKTVEMLIDVYHETETHTFPSYLPARTDWQQKPQKVVGTHYIRSITYGGRLIISYRLQANKKENMEKIKASVNANLQFSGKLDIDVKGKLDKLTKEVSDKSSVEINAYATTGVFNQPTTIDAIFKLIDEYPKMVKKFNNGLGSPLQIELVPLNTIQPNYTEYVKQRALDGVLNAAADKLDDLNAVMNVWDSWLDDHLEDMEDEEDAKAEDFEQRFKEASETMKNAISRLDATKGPEQFDEAFKVYGEGPKNVPNRYMREFLKIKSDVEKKPFLWFPFTKAVTSYIRWGNITCTIPTSDPLFIGYAATTSGHGNGGNLQCLRAEDPALESKKLSDNVPKSTINGVIYELPKQSGQVFCAFCVLQNATSTFVVTGSNHCPSKSKLEYAGYLMLHNHAGAVSSPICLDQDPVNSLPDQYPSMKDKTLEPLVPYWIECPECERVHEKFLPCAVCSR